MTHVNAFDFAVTPQLHFGTGKISLLPVVVSAFGKNILLITGGRSFLDSAYGPPLLQQLSDIGGEVAQHRIDREPSPAMIDNAVNRFSASRPDCIVAIGGGSVLDAGKAVSAMLPINAPVKDYLEGVGTKAHPGTKIPFVAIPTTSGTGSEATKNAVISQTGHDGYKRSLRHGNFVPNVAIVDPMLALSCPPSITAASGMDAFTQLLESYVSATANPLTDALAYEGLRHIATSLKAAYDDGTDVPARTGMALASYISGVTLANAGLGLVHGFASPLGGYFEIPHGVICSALMAPVNEVTVRKLRLTKTNPEALAKYAGIGKLFAGSDHRPQDFYIDSLLHVIQNFTEELQIPSLSKFGVKPVHYEKVISATDHKNHPISLARDELAEVLERAAV